MVQRGGLCRQGGLLRCLRPDAGDSPETLPSGCASGGLLPPLGRSVRVRGRARGRMASLGVMVSGLRGVCGVCGRRVGVRVCLDGKGALPGMARNGTHGSVPPFFGRAHTSSARGTVSWAVHGGGRCEAPATHRVARVDARAQRPTTSRNQQNKKNTPSGRFKERLFILPTG